MKIDQTIEEIRKDRSNGICVVSIVDENGNIIENIDQLGDREMVCIGESYLLLKIPMLDYIGKMKLHSNIPDHEIKQMFMEEIDFILEKINSLPEQPFTEENTESGE